MNCRILENLVFKDPAVAGILKDNFIEARLHTDGDADERRARNRAVQSRVTKSVANPWLVIMDPNDEEPLAESGFERAPALIEFLNSVL